MEKSVDLRIQKTRKALSEAFMQLLTQKKYEDITVNELCDTALIRRATFYKHFADKEDFFSFIIREVIDHYKVFMEQDDQGQSNPRDYYIRVVKEVLHLLEDHRTLFQSLKQSRMLPTLSKMIEEEVQWIVLAHIVEDEKKGITFPVKPAGLMASIFTGALMSMGIWWLEQKNPMPKEALISELSECILKL